MHQVIPFALAALLIPTHGAYADGCLLAPAKLPDGAMKMFMDKPGDIFDRYPGGGPAMSAEIMRRVGTDVGVLEVVIQLARDGTTAHRVAIGIGLARAASACSRVRPDLEAKIKHAVANAVLSELATAFAAGMSSFEASALSSTAAPLAGASIGSGPPASFGGSGTTPPLAGGGSAPVVDVPVFSSRSISSTYGNTISPTRRR